MKIIRNTYFLPLRFEQGKQFKAIKLGCKSQHASPDISAAKSKRLFFTLLFQLYKQANWYKSKIRELFQPILPKLKRIIQVKKPQNWNQSTRIKRQFTIYSIKFIIQSQYCTINESKKVQSSKSPVQQIEQGIQIKQIANTEKQKDIKDENEKKIQKHNKLSEFVQTISQFEENCLNMTHAINIRGIEISEFYSQQIKKFESFFIVLNKLIHNEEEKYLSELKNLQELSHAQYQKALIEIDYIIKELELSKTDIKSNYESIMDKMNLEAFNNTMNQYKEKINHYSQTSQQLYNKQLQITKFTFFKKDIDDFNKEIGQNINQMLQNIIIKQLNPVQFIKKQSQHPELKSNSLFISLVQNDQLENLIAHQNLNNKKCIKQNCSMNLDPSKCDYQTPKIAQKLQKPFNSYSLPDDKVKEALNLGLSQLESSRFLSLVDKYENYPQNEQDKKELNPVQESIEFQKHCLPKNNFTFSKADNIANNPKLLESLTGNLIQQSLEYNQKINLEYSLKLDGSKQKENNQILKIVDIDSPHFQEGFKRLEF